MQPLEFFPARSTSVVQPRFLHLALSVAVLLTLAAPRVAAQAPPDFGAGIDKFTQLGLPDVKNARYVKIKWTSGEYQFDRHSMGEGPKLEGNAWLLEEKPGKSATVLVNELKQTEVLHPKVMEQKQKELMEKMQKQAQQAPIRDDDDDFDEEMGFDFEDVESAGEWKDADLAKDAKALIDWLTKAGEKGENARGVNDPQMFAMQFNGGVHFFFFATHAYQKGLKAEANQIIDLVFKRVGDNRKVLSSAMSELADVQYAAAYAKFSKAGDWKQYLTDMDTLLQRYPGVWRDRPIVEKVAASVRKHLAAPEPPAIAGEGVTPEDQKLADALARDKKPLRNLQQYAYSGPIWLMPSQPMFGPPATGTNAAPLQRILQRKVQAIPLLIAMLKDDYLLRVQAHQGMSHHFSSGDDDDAMTAEEIDQRLEGYSRPVSRGEIARTMLAGLVLPEQARYDRSKLPNVEEIARRSREWYEKHKAKSEKELLRFFLAEGKQNEQQMALNHLMRSRDEADLKEVERYLMTPEKLADRINQVVNYARTRGPKAKPFVTEFLAKARALPSLLPSHASNNRDARYRKRLEDQAKEQLKALEELASDKPADAVLKEMLAADKKWDWEELNRSSQVLRTKLASEGPEKALTLLLQGALDAKDDTLAGFLLQNAAQVPYMKLEQEAALVRGRPKPVKLPLEKYAELWQRLLAQDRKASSMQMYYGFGGGSAPTHRQTTAMMLESLHGQNEESPAMMRRGMEMQTLGELVYDLYVRRAEARLAGKPDTELPAFPDKSKVTDVRKGELRRQLAVLTTADQPKFLTGLALDEVLVLPDLVKEDAKLNEKLAPGAHLIRTINVGITNDALTKLCESFKDKPLDKKTLEALVEQTKQLVKGGTAVMVSLARIRPLAGVQLSVRPLPAMMSAQYGRYGFGDDDSAPARPGMVAAQVYAMQAGVQGNAQWTVEMPKPEPADGKKGDDDLLKSAVGNRFGNADYLKEQEEKFWEAFGKLLEPSLNVCEAYFCTLNGIVPQPRKK